MVSFRVTTTNMAARFATILSLFLSFSCTMATIMDFSKETWPVMTLRVAHLEAEREELHYGSHTIPKSKGFIELECIVADSSLPSSLGFELTEKVTGIKWILPNPKIVEEGRAFIKHEGMEPKLHTSLVITDFKKDEDYGDYTCQMTFEDDSITRYKETINIPALDGSPIISCELKCQRNTNEDCQLAGPYDLFCKTYSFYETNTKCDFTPCVSEEKCPPPMIDPILGGWIPSTYLNLPTPMYLHENKLQQGGIAGISGRFDCRTHNRRKTTMVSVYASVSVAETKTGGISLIPLIVGPDGQPIHTEPPTPKFLASMWPEFLHDLHHVEFGCWTSHEVGNFEWTYRPVNSQQETIITDEIASKKGMEIHQELMYGGRGCLFTINKFTADMGGYYTCKAIDKNDYSVHSKEFVIPSTKWGPDTDMNSEKTITATVNSSITLTCDMMSTATGDFFHWEKEHLTDAAIAHLSPSDKYEFSNDSQTLTVHNVAPGDEGRYGCRQWGAQTDGSSFAGHVTVLISDTPPDPYQKMEVLNEVLKTLDDAGHELLHVIRSMDTQHDHGHGHHDRAHDHGLDHQDHGHHDHHHGHNHQDHGHDYQDHGHHDHHGHDSHEDHEDTEAFEAD